MPAAEKFVKALNEQIAREFGASHQYAAIAVYYESTTLPQLAGFFYGQALEERGHALMMVKYLIDSDSPVRFKPIAEPSSDFADHIAPIRLALEQEREVSGQISQLFELAREERDYLSEQFMQWFLKEQVEEEATMNELLDVAERVREFPFTLEEYIARETPGSRAADPLAPPVAGGG